MNRRRNCFGRVLELFSPPNEALHAKCNCSIKDRRLQIFPCPRTITVETCFLSLPALYRYPMDDLQRIHCNNMAPCSHSWSSIASPSHIIFISRDASSRSNTFECDWQPSSSRSHVQATLSGTLGKQHSIWMGSVSGRRSCNVKIWEWTVVHGCLCTRNLVSSHLAMKYTSQTHD